MTVTERIPNEGWTVAGHAEARVSLMCQEEEQDLWPYRSRTMALLRRYGRTSVELGRTPSVLGREFFRSRVTSKTMKSFEDVVVFVADMERALEEIDTGSQRLLAMYVLEEYTLSEIARRLGCSERTVARLVHESIDRFSQVLLTKRLINTLPQAAIETAGGPEWVS